MNSLDATALRGALEAVWPADLAGRPAVLNACCRHGELVAEANRSVNLTRVTSADDMAVKHILDSLLAGSLFESATSILDMGSGAGYPGIPLAILFPDKPVVLAESVQKKARCVGKFVEELGLANVEVIADRAEAILRQRSVSTVTARAVGPVARILKTLKPVRARFRELLLYKGPNLEQELRDAAQLLDSMKMNSEVAMRYELPKSLGARSILRVRPADRSEG